MFLKTLDEKQKFILKTQIENAWNLEFYGVKTAVMHFVAQFTHVFRHFGGYCRKQKKTV